MKNTINIVSDQTSELLAKTVAEGLIADPVALFIDLYNAACERHAPDAPTVSSEKYLPRGFVEAVRHQLVKMTTPLPPPPPKPEPTMEDLLARMVSRVTGGKVDGVMAGQEAIREHLRKVDNSVAGVTTRQRDYDGLAGRLKRLEDRPAAEMAAVLRRIQALEERPTQTLALEQLEARLNQKFDALKAELEETVMDLMTGEALKVEPEPETAAEAGQNHKFRISICDPLVSKFANKIRAEAPRNVRLYFENMDATPSATMGTRHFVVISGRARKQWVEAFRARIPSERLIMIDRMGTTNLLKLIVQLASQPYFEA